MKKTVFINLGSIFLLLLIVSMGVVFFTCGDDDDEWEGGDDDDDATSGCSSIMSKIAQCQESDDWVTTIGWGIELDTANEWCFLAWCGGAGYDTVGFFSYYDFNADCFNGNCDDLLVNFDAYGEMYDECHTMDVLMYALLGIEYRHDFHGSCLYDSGE